MLEGGGMQEAKFVRSVSHKAQIDKSKFFHSLVEWPQTWYLITSLQAPKRPFTFVLWRYNLKI